MIAKSKLYKGYVYICASRKHEHIRIPTGIKVPKLNSNGLLNKSSGVEDPDEKNNHIRALLKKVQAALDDYPKLTAKEISTYVKTGALPEAPKEKRQLDLLECFQKFIDDSRSGVRLNAKGTRLAENTIRTYESVQTNLHKFKEVFSLEWSNVNDDWYNKFCDYYWYTLNSYDNNAGKAVKIVKTFLAWCQDERLIPIPVATKKWKVWKEDIDILVMYIDEIKLLHTMPITSERLDRTRDIFLMGIFTCFRIEDLLALTERNLHVLNNDYYISTLVTKTMKQIRIKMNPIGVSIIQKHRGKFHTLLPVISSAKFNENLKDLAASFKNHINELKEKGQLGDLVGNNWNKDFRRARTKKGVYHYEYVKPERYISSHCMRRSGITNLLMLGMTPYEVQQISGHSLNSKDFTKYVKIASQVVDTKSVDAWSKVLA